MEWRGLEKEEQEMMKKMDMVESILQGKSHIFLQNSLRPQ